MCFTETLSLESILKKITSLKIITSSIEAAGWIFFRSAPWHRAVARAVRPRILIPRARRLSTCISRDMASVVGQGSPVVALRGRKRGHLGEKVVENGVFRFLFFTPLFYQNGRVCARVAPQRRKLDPRNSPWPEICMSTGAVREE